jgi:hypothetical protein
MRETGHMERSVREGDDLYIEFTNNDLAEPFGSVQVRAEQTDDRVVCKAEWGGWSWRAEAGDRVTAQNRLNDRLARLDPFAHADADWGHPGYQTGVLDESIPPATRQRMRDYTQREARSAVGLLEAVFEAQARRPWAFPGESDEVMTGVEIEGLVRDDGRLALFARTFYDIAGAYFGRGANGGGAGQGGGDARGAEPGLAGALRRLTEKGYMRTDDARLRHQLRAVEVYVFDPQA